jgi:WD40 repeat protein
MRCSGYLHMCQMHDLQRLPADAPQRGMPATLYKSESSAQQGSSVGTFRSMLTAAHAAVHDAHTCAARDTLSRVVLVRRGDVHLVSGSEHRPLVFGHAAHAYAAAWNPKHQHQFVSAGKDGVFLWSAQQRQLVAKCSLGAGVEPSSVCFSPDGSHVAVGCASGALHVLLTDCGGEPPLSMQAFSTAVAEEALSVVRYSPNGHYLATGSHDNFIDLFACKSGSAYGHLRRCYGHSSYITHIDWAADSSVFVSNCGAYELLHWEARTGKRVTRTQRDTRMAEWTCALGFPVMGIFPDFSDGTDVDAVSRTFTPRDPARVAAGRAADERDPLASAGTRGRYVATGAAAACLPRPTPLTAESSALCRG